MVQVALRVHRAGQVLVVCQEQADFQEQADGVVLVVQVAPQVIVAPQVHQV